MVNVHHCEKCIFMFFNLHNLILYIKIIHHLFQQLMTSLTLTQANAIVQGAIAAARASGFRPMGIVVIDAAAQVKASAREDGASALRLDIALGKAGASVGMGVNSRALVERAKDIPAFFAAIASVAEQKFVPQTGAVLILDAQGNVLGAAGASGGTGDEDEQIIIAGIVASGLRPA
jgi:uncharacterized protein GlcG (DUF336 family)